MKKIISFILILVMLVSLCACGNSSEEEDVRGNITTNGGTDAPGTDAPETNAPETDEPETDAPEVSLGSVNGATYRSDFIGLTITLPGEWVFYSDEEILELNNLTQSILEEDVAEALKEAAVIYDMYATNQLTGASININLEKLNLLQLASLDYEAVVDSIFEMLIPSFEEVGYSDIEYSYEKITVDGKEMDGYNFVGYYFGMEYRMTGLMFTRGNYMVTITLGALDSAEIDELISSLDFD